MRVIGNGERIPYGLSMRKNTQIHLWELWFTFPVIRLYKRHIYNINEDRFEDGWRTLRIAFMWGRVNYGVYDLRVAKGWTD